MTNAEITFSNAMTEAVEEHIAGNNHSYMVSSYKCPNCNGLNLHVNVYEINEFGYRFEVDVDCPSCKEKRTFRS